MVLIIILEGCFNPFAPKLDEDLSGGSGLISDQTNVEGIFQNLRYAYSFKDTTIYGQLLDDDFSFVYRDYENGVDVSWSREEEMKVTNGLFANSERLDLTWNNIVGLSTDSTNIIRSFNLSITFNPTDIVFIDGRVNLDLIKSNGKWKILRWIDESNF